MTGAAPLRAGIGLRAIHHSDVIARRPNVGWLEAHSENYFARGGATRAVLERVRRDYPLSLHGVGLSLGSTDELDARHLGEIVRLSRDMQPALISEHLCWGSVGGRFVNDLQTTLFWLRLVQLLLAIPLFALAGQGATGLLARMMGQPPQNNFIYRLFALVASPVVKPCRWITPKFVADRHLPLVAFALLAVGYLWTMLAIANACVGAGVPVAQCLQGR